jgi:hypothetical protein
MPMWPEQLDQDRAIENVMKCQRKLWIFVSVCCAVFGWVVGFICGAHYMTSIIKTTVKTAF